MIPYMLGSDETNWPGVIQGDALELCRWLPDESIDLIFTDPPYSKEFVPLYEWVAKEGKRLLRPGGFCLVMCGGAYLNEIMCRMGRHLDYYWMYHVSLVGRETGKVHPRGTSKPVIIRQKQIAAWSKGRSEPRTVTYDVMSGNGTDKRFHRWGQDVRSARYFIDCFSRANEVVLDPFAGGGTTAVACRLLGRRWLLMDEDRESVDTIRARLLGLGLPMFDSLGLQSRMQLLG